MHLLPSLVQWSVPSLPSCFVLPSPPSFFCGMFPLSSLAWLGGVPSSRWVGCSLLPCWARCSLFVWWRVPSHPCWVVFPLLDGVGCLLLPCRVRAALNFENQCYHVKSNARSSSQSEKPENTTCSPNRRLWRQRDVVLLVVAVLFCALLC